MGPGVAAHTFNLSSQTPEPGGLLSSRPACPTKPVPRQQSLGSEGKHSKQKTSEDVIELSSQVLASARQNLEALAMWI